MPSTFSTFHIGWRGLFASRMGMDVTAHNVANAHTEGYSRQSVKIVASRPYAVPGLNRPTTPGQIGTGVDVASINRTKDQFVRNLLQREQSIMGVLGNQGPYIRADRVDLRGTLRYGDSVCPG